MSRIFVTGSSTGLGLMSAQLLIAQGHEVVLHARNTHRADDARREAPGAKACVMGDLSTMAGARSAAEQANALGPFDAVIHNAGIGYREPRRVSSDAGIPEVFAVNVLAPYILTALIARPARLVYLSSGMHRRVSPVIDDMLWTKRDWDGSTAYAESKFYDTALAFAAARLWPAVHSNALEPGWVPTRMGGPGAPDDLSKGHVTQVWLAASSDPLALSSGEYFAHKEKRAPNPGTRERRMQDALLRQCERLSGVTLPA